MSVVKKVKEKEPVYEDVMENKGAKPQPDMVQFHNGETPNKYVTITECNAECNMAMNELKSKTSPLYGRIARRTRCRGDVMWMKLITFVLVLLIFVLLYMVLSQRNDINALRFLIRSSGNSQQMKLERFIGETTPATFKVDSRKVDVSKDICINQGQMYRENEYYEVDCNKCVCTKVGLRVQFACTNLACPGSVQIPTTTDTCMLRVGAATGGIKFALYNVTRPNCIKECLDYQKNDPSINGVMTYSDSAQKNGCWCAKKMTSIIPSTRFMACFIKPQKNETTTGVTVNSNDRCIFSVGNVATGYKNLMSRDMTKNDCIDMCIRLQKVDDKINGVTISTNSNNRLCWCVRNLEEIDSDGEYQTCFIKPNTTVAFKPNSFCVFQSGDAKATSHFKVGNIPGTKCVEACIKLKEYDDTINGVTVNSNIYQPGCWCNKDMSDIKSNSVWKTCYIVKNKTQVIKESHPSCKFKIGGVTGGGKIFLGTLNKDKCIAACKVLHSQNRNINGVSMYNDSRRAGCWCSYYMSSINWRTYYKTCYLKMDREVPLETPPYPYQFQSGSAHGSLQFNVKVSKDRCVATCWQLKQIDPTINGATIEIDKTNECWCTRNMFKIDSKTGYKTTFLNDMGIPQNYNGDSLCQFKQGDGEGGSEIKIGHQRGKKCIDACLAMREYDPFINGVNTFSDSRLPGCWCEVAMTSTKADPKYKVCALNDTVLKLKT